MALAAIQPTACAGFAPELQGVHLLGAWARRPSPVVHSPSVGSNDVTAAKLARHSSSVYLALGSVPAPPAQVVDRRSVTCRPARRPRPDVVVIALDVERSPDGRYVESRGACWGALRMETTARRGRFLLLRKGDGLSVQQGDDRNR